MDKVHDIRGVDAEQSVAIVSPHRDTSEIVSISIVGKYYYAEQCNVDAMMISTLVADRESSFIVCRKSAKFRILYILANKEISSGWL